jgi:hypothetical protein
MATEIKHRSLKDIVEHGPEDLEDALWAMQQPGYDKLNAQQRLQLEQDLEDLKAQIPTTQMEIFSKVPDFDTLSNQKEIKTISQATGQPEYVDDKDHLVGKELIIGYWDFQESTKVPGKEMVKAVAVLKEVDPKTGQNKKVTFTDFSTGILAQLKLVGAWKEGMAIYCPRGLRVSRDYKVKMDNGQEIKGTTYYLNES